MFALNRFSVAAQDGGRHNTLAMEMARAIHPAFMTDRDSERPRMHWKMTMDLRSTLVTTEGGLDPFDGYVVFSLLHESRQKGEPGLEKEIAEYKRIVESKYGPYNSEDPLDLGMMLWACHWKSDEEWSNVLKEGAVTALSALLLFSQGPR